MSLLLNEDQIMLKQSAEEFVRDKSPLSRLRGLREGQGNGSSLSLWKEMAGLGWHGILVPEQYGGLGLGYTEMACVLEACGRTLAPEPLLSTLLLGANAVLLAGSEEQKSEILAAVAGGERLLALAYQERGSRYDPLYCTTSAEKTEDGYLLSGQKTLVYDASSADFLIVSARLAGAQADAEGLGLFLVEADTPGLEIVAQSTMHLRPAALVKLNDVKVDAAARLGDEAGEILGQVIDRATLGLCAEMLGNMQAAFDMTMEYLKTRTQFGVPIGSFQALKHRAACLFVEIELSRSAVMGACEAIDQGREDFKEAVSVAKARCSDTAVLAGYEGIQMHGGIGMTDEHDIGFFAKRARGSELTFGDAAYHRDRFAGLQGF
ncbi:MAG: acyl-CoA dehydrogenase family protein [Deltaproteobacteria bacterium]